MSADVKVVAIFAWLESRLDASTQKTEQKLKKLKKPKEFFKSEFIYLIFNILNKKFFT